MMTIVPRAPLVALLLLLIFGNAWASEGPAHGNELDLESCNREKLKTETAEVWTDIIVTHVASPMAPDSGIAGALQEDAEADAQASPPSQPPAGPSDADDALQLRRRLPKSPTALEAAQITTPPIPPLHLLLPRQDQAQVDALNARIQELQRSAQQALQVLSDQSRSVSQASQQLSQESVQLSQANSRLSASSLEQSLQLSVATQSVQSLTSALSSALASGSAALASATSSAAAELSTKVGDALAQATAARNQADQDIRAAQSNAVSITQAAAIVVGASAASAILAVVIVLLVLRYRRKKQRERELAAENGSAYGGSNLSGKGGGGGGAGGAMFLPRPETAGSWNSMTAAMRDVKEPGSSYAAPPPAPAAGNTTASRAVDSDEGDGVAGSNGIVGDRGRGGTTLQRFQSARIVDVSRNASSSSSSRSASAATAVTAVGRSSKAKKGRRESALGERLQRMGLTRRSTSGPGLAITTNNEEDDPGGGGSGGGGGEGGDRDASDNGMPAQVAEPRSQPVVVVAAPPTPRSRSRSKGRSSSSDTSRADSAVPRGGAGPPPKTPPPPLPNFAVKTPTFSVFPRVDPDPQGTAAAQQLAANNAKARVGGGGGGGGDGGGGDGDGDGIGPTLDGWIQTQNAAAAAERRSRGGPPSAGAGPATRFSGVKWPLVDKRLSKNWIGAGVDRSATDASSRYSTQLDEEAAAAAARPPPVVVFTNPAYSPKPVVVGPGRSVVGSAKMKVVGLPGSVRPK